MKSTLQKNLGLLRIALGFLGLSVGAGYAGDKPGKPSDVPGGLAPKSAIANMVKKNAHAPRGKKVKHPAVPLPKVNTPYQVHSLLELMQTHDKTRTFIVPVQGTGKPMTTAEFEASPDKIVGSATITRLHLTDKLDPMAEVTLKESEGLANALLKSGRLTDKVKADYLKRALYADIGGYPMFIAEPFPRKIRNGDTSTLDHVIKAFDPAGAFTPKRITGPAKGEPITNAGTAGKRKAGAGKPVHKPGAAGKSAHKAGPESQAISKSEKPLTIEQMKNAKPMPMPVGAK